MTHNIIFPLGDYSFDGHNCVAYFVVKSKKPVEEVRKVHVANNWIGELCKKYRDNKLPFHYCSYFPQAGITFLKKLVDKYNLTTNAIKKDGNWVSDELLLQEEVDEELMESEDWEDFYYVEVNAEALMDFWVFALNQSDSELSLTVKSPALSSHRIKYKGYGVKEFSNLNPMPFEDNYNQLAFPGYGVWVNHDGEYYNNVC